MPFDGSARKSLLVEPRWVAEHLADPSLRVFDCTIVLTPTPDDPFHTDSGRDAWARGHVPGSGFLDLERELSAPASDAPLRYTLPSAQQFAEAMSRHGVGDGMRVVLYSAGHPMWATRVWWMLRAFGFDDASVMDGGWDRWVVEAHPVSTEPCRHAPARFIARPRPSLIADKSEVRRAIGNPRVRLINALTRKQHAGEGVHYGRPGRIPGSTCVPAWSLVERGKRTFQPQEALRAAFVDAGLEPGQRVITYCGGGIGAACDAFALALLGHHDVAVYDGSLAEWSNDPAMPMELG